MAKLSAMWNTQSLSIVVDDKIRQVIGKFFVIPNNTLWNSAFAGLTRAKKLVCKNKLELAADFNSMDI